MEAMMEKGSIEIDVARLADVDRMKEILDGYAGEGELLGRSRMDFYEHLRDFVVARVDGEVVGLSALQIIWDDLCEVRSLAVEESARGRGVGGALLARCLDDARDLAHAIQNALTRFVFEK